LAEFLKEYLDIVIPDRKICPDHSSPFSFVADVFFGRVVDAIVWACRSGGKSFNEALLTFLDSHFHKKCDTTVLAGSFYQGKQVYDATLDLWDQPGWTGFLVGDPTKSETLLRNGSGYEVLTASQKSVRGPHPQRLKLDEIDELAPDLYDAALSQPLSKHGVKASTIMTSTMHRVYGLMQTIIEDRHRMGLELYKWCWLEVVERCGDACEDVGDKESKWFGKQCNLWEDCQGRAHDADGYYPVEDVRGMCAKLDAETWKSEWGVVRPSAKDMVYDPEDLEASTNEEIPAESSYPAFGAVDPGFVKPTAFVVAEERLDEVAIVKEWYWERVLLTERVNMIKEIYEEHGLRGIYADAENRDFVEEMRAAGMKVESVSFARHKDRAVSQIRQFLRDRRLKISTACPMLIREMFRLHYKAQKEEIAKEDDHGPDALVALFKRYVEVTEQRRKVVRTVRLARVGRGR